MSIQISTDTDVFNFYVIFQPDFNIPVGAITDIDYHQDAHVSDVISIFFTTVSNYHRKTICSLCLDYVTYIWISNYSKIANYSSADFFIRRHIYSIYADSINYIFVSNLWNTSYISTISGDFKCLFFVTNQLPWTNYDIVFNHDIIVFA